MLNRTTQAEVGFLLREKDAIVDRWIERVKQQVNSRFFAGAGMDRAFISQFFAELVDAVDKNLYRNLNKTFDALVQHERRNGYTVKDAKAFLFSVIPAAVEVLEEKHRAASTFELVLQRLRAVEGSLRGVYSERAARGLLEAVKRNRAEIAARWVDELPTPIISTHFAVIATDDRSRFVAGLLEIYEALLRGEEQETVTAEDGVKRTRLDQFLATTIDFYEPKGFLISDLLRAVTHLSRLLEPHLAREYAAQFIEYRIAWLSLQDALDTLALRFAAEYNERGMKNYYNEVSIMLHRIKNKLTACPTTLQTLLMIPFEGPGAEDMPAGDPLIVTVEEGKLLTEAVALRQPVLDAVNELLASTAATPDLTALRAAAEPYAAWLAVHGAALANGEFKLDPSSQEMVHELLLMAYDGGNMTTELTRELQLRQNELYQREPPKHKEIDLYSLVKHAYDECVVEATSRNQSFEFEGQDEGVYVVGVENELKRPFVQIIENGLKYTPDGGVILVKVWSDNGHARFFVKDSGIGIPPGEENLVFGLCERCSNAKDFNKNGTGTGLYNDRKVILHHNGDVWVVSDGVGKGSTFHIKLPIFRRTTTPVELVAD